MKAKARAYGAATIINAIGLGKGAAFGLDLWTEATVELKKYSSTITVTIMNDPHEDQNLAYTTVKLVLQQLQLEKYGANIAINSTIPIAKGLKSSSVAANALTLATASAANVHLTDKEIVNLAVKASIKSHVTITGAVDDAYASYLGGVVITNNMTRQLIKKYPLPDNLEAIIFIPKVKRYTRDVNVESLQRLAPLTQILWNEALEGRYWPAMTLNGYLHSVALQQNPEIALQALRLGAVAAGLSGKGPSTVAVADKEVSPLIIQAWKKSDVTVIKTKLNNRKSEVIE